jgi:hypothetical protein
VSQQGLERCQLWQRELVEQGQRFWQRAEAAQGPELGQRTQQLRLVALVLVVSERRVERDTGGFVGVEAFDGLLGRRVRLQ